MSATVRPARASEADRLHALQSVLAEPAPALLSAALAATTETPAEHAGDPVVSTADSFVLLVSVTDSGRVVGYVLAIAGRETHIAELVVGAEHRRQGRGRALLDAAIEQGPSPVSVHVAVDNDAARELYESAGFMTVTDADEQFEETDGRTLRYEPERED
ncbi:MAG: acetyltransferase [Halonotius sp. J07HN6]|nr:MAG: acetyltransferase [Halonotius sp. J07HN6]